MVDEDRDRRVRCDVAQALEIGAPLGLEVNREVQGLPIDSEADRNDVRPSIGAGRRQSRNRRRRESTAHLTLVHQRSLRLSLPDAACHRSSGLGVLISARLRRSRKAEPMLSPASEISSWPAIVSTQEKMKAPAASASSSLSYDPPGPLWHERSLACGGYL